MNKKHILKTKKAGILATSIVLLLISPIPVRAYEIISSEGALENAVCAEDCQEVGGVKCNEDEYCAFQSGRYHQNMCSARDLDCCCILEENTREIRIGRLTDKTEYLSDEIVEETDKVIENTEGLIEEARAVYGLSGQCTSDPCEAKCEKEKTCAGCECGGCPAGTYPRANWHCDNVRPGEACCCTTTCVPIGEYLGGADYSIPDLPDVDCILVEECSARENVCTGGKVAAPGNCTTLEHSFCVNSINRCNQLHGNPQADNCRPLCEDEETCCALRNACVKDYGDCGAMGGTVIDNEGFCFERCSELGYHCCVGIVGGAKSGDDLNCGADGACCYTSYWLCEPKGCFGEPCPSFGIGGIISYLDQIIESQETIEEYYSRMESEIPPELEEVRRKMGDCFTEKDPTEGIFSMESDINEMVDCQTLIDSEEIPFSHMPDEEGDPKDKLQQACYGRDYCRAMIKEGKQDELPYPGDCAEDFYCITWR